MKARQYLALPVLAVVAACASYAPLPLDANPQALAQPVAEILQVRASAIERPWLQPVAIDLSAPLSPQGVAALAVVNNPDLIALRARAGVSDAQVFAAGLLPDPSFSIGADKVLSGPDTFLNLAGAVGLNINALRKRAVTRQQADAQARQVRLDLAWAEWQMAGQARIQAVRVLGLTAITALSEASATAAADLSMRSSRAAANGDISASDAEAARLAAHDAANQLRVDRQDLLTAQQELARLLGLPPASRLALAPAVLPGTPPPDETLFAMARDARTDLAALRAGYDAQEASVHSAVLDQFSALNLTVNANRDTANNFTLGPAIDFSLPLWNRNRGGIAVERATREALKAEYEARLFQTRADIAAASAGIALARRQRGEAESGLEQLQQLARASAAAARRGDIAPAAAQAMQQQLRDRMLVIARADEAIREQSIALELLSGQPIEEWK